MLRRKVIASESYLCIICILVFFCKLRAIFQRHLTQRKHRKHFYARQKCCVLFPVSAKLHYTDTGYGHVVQHHQRTKLCHIAMPEPNISTCQDVRSRYLFGKTVNDC